MAAFVGACRGRDDERAREARELAARVCALAYDGGDLEAAEDVVLTLEEWADELVDHPYHPGVPRPDEADRLTRDHLKDVLRDELTTPARDWMSGTQLSLDVDFNALRRTRGLDRRIREDAFYAYGRGTMALDLGHRAAARREVARLRELRDTYAS
ncbi:hypothetical protein [Streptomyces sp. NBC_01092]|uniref:hypothetical protein n=1 Tax=Streptomyces sp. NBC_01092 TaxID=2903748 RepID=UPI00386B2541|nr:hypothetical protein OG254_28435 [Streptomyces sp. NBC_01092]